MRFSILALIASVATASAQTTACPALNIVDACLGTTQTTLLSCPTNDWSCMCAAQKAVVTCYNNCPGDARAPSAKNQELQWCNAASQAAALSSTTSAPVSAAAATTTSAGSTTTSTTVRQTGAAVAIGASGSGVLAMAIGIAGLL